MSETKALILTFVAMLALVLVAWIGLALLDAKEEVFVAVILPIGCGGALALSGVVDHYAPPDERKR